MIHEKVQTWIRRVLYILFGSFLYAVAINALFIPHRLLSGGLTGIAIMLEYIFNIPTAIMILILNIPLFIGGYRYISKRFAYLSVLGIVSSSFFLFLTNTWVIQIESTMVAAILGGLFAGIGTGVVIKNRGSLGGTDIISILVNKYLSFNIGGVAIAINAVVIAIGALLFNVEIAMLTLVALFVGNKALDAIQEGFNHRKTIIIVTDHHKEVAEQLLASVRRGITFINGEGAYTGREKRLIYMVVRTMELAKIKDIVRRVDPNAFVSIIDTREVEGKGFNISDLF